MSSIYSETYSINIGKEIYQLQALDTPDGTFFLMKYWGKLICTITWCDKDKWQVDTDMDINMEVITEILKWIETLFM